MSFPWKPSGTTAPKLFQGESCNCGTVFDYDKKLQREAEIEQRMSAGDFWNNQERAKEFVAELKGLKGLLKPLSDCVQTSNDLPSLLEMAAEDESLAGDVRYEIERLEVLLDELELKALLNGPHDSAGALVTIYARDGGTDAHDWAEMMLRMYTQWAQKNGYEVALFDRSDNEVAGINSATIAIRGPMAYGYLKGETGIHRLVRISPFNSEGKRQTSFAAIDVAPEIYDDTEIKVDWDKDVREETMRAGGAGGQHVNKTESAIRLLHYETGIDVKCQNERSQHQNRALARKMLIARLVRHEEEKREAESARKYQSQAKVGFGSQIRNYFLHPDQRVKDSRTGYYEGNFHKVLDGDLQGFFDAYLKWKAKGEVRVADGED